MQEYWWHKCFTSQNYNERMWHVVTAVASYRQLERLSAYKSNGESGPIELGKPMSVPGSVDLT